MKRACDVQAFIPSPSPPSKQSKIFSAATASSEPPNPGILKRKISTQVCSDGMHGCYLTKRLYSRMRLVCHVFVFTSSCHKLWSITEQTHGNMRGTEKINNKLASYRLTVREFVLVYGIFKSQTLRFVRPCSAASLLLVQSRKIANTFSKLQLASRSDETFCEDFFQVSISKATLKRTQPTTPTMQGHPTTIFGQISVRKTIWDLTLERSPRIFGSFFSGWNFRKGKFWSL